MSEGAREVKQKILEQTGDVIDPEATIIYDATGRLRVVGLESPIEPASHPGDDDPSRDIGSAEVAMTFAPGRDDPLVDYLKERSAEMRMRLSSD